MISKSFQRFAGACAIAAAVVGFLYAVAFVIVRRSVPDTGALLSALFLMLGGLLSIAPLIAIYQRLRETEPGFALWSLLLGLLGAAGAHIHGAYDLANAIHPPAVLPTDLPSQIDPRALLTFGAAGLALLMIAWLIGRGRQFPHGLGVLGYASGVLLIILYLSRLIILTPTSPVIFVPALLEGFVVNPVWYFWLGMTLWRSGRG